jgi:DNA excision repair protein ERCC-8
VDNTNEGRFLLCGSKDGTVSVFDLSLLGSDYHINHAGADVSSSCPLSQSLNWEQQHTFHAICHSQKVHATNRSQTIDEMHANPNYLPAGHSCPITNVQWYPIDSGVFLTSDCIGNILLWDSNSFTPASCMTLSKTGDISATSSSTLTSWNRASTASVPSQCTINSFDLPKNVTINMQLAVGCSQINKSLGSSGMTNALSLTDDRAVYLCDIRSGATTQQLIGHGMGHGQYGNRRGISNVQWSPVDEFILASSGGDGCIKMWDVRKSGSTACLTTLDQEMKIGSKQLLEFECTHDQLGGGGLDKRKRKRKRVMLDSFAPGNYSKVECSNYIQSHDGPIASFSFSPDGEYIVSASPIDGMHLWHIQKGNNVGVMMPTCYLGPESLKHPFRNKQRNIPLYITQPASNKSSTLWVGGAHDLLGYDIHGMGGRPNRVLSAHLDAVTAITSQHNSMRIFTGGADGMVLSWGFANSNNNEQ